MSTSRTPHTNSFLLSLVVGALVFAAAEVTAQGVYRWRHLHSFWTDKPAEYIAIKQPYNPFTPYGLTEYAARITIPMESYPAKLATDRYGFVHNGADMPLLSDDYLVFLLGGSTVEGRGATANEHTIAGYLERLLNARSRMLGRHIRVLNGGITGYNSFQQAERIAGSIAQKFHGRGLKPSLIVSLDGRNDAFYATAFADHGWLPNWQPYYDSLGTQVNHAMSGVDHGMGQPIRRLALWAPYHSAFLYGFKLVMSQYHVPGIDNSLFPQTVVPLPDQMDRAVVAYATNHRVAALRSAALGARYVGFLQPTLLPEMKKTMSPGETDALHVWNAHFHDASLYSEGVNAFYAGARRAEAKDHYFHDISMVFDSLSEAMYWDSCHYLDKANERIATAIADVVVPMVVNELKI